MGSYDLAKQTTRCTDSLPLIMRQFLMYKLEALVL